MSRSIYQSLRARYAGDYSTRRDFLRRSAALTVGVLLAPSLVFSKSNPQKHIAVIGAGLAGLSCAYELVRAGYRVTVLEARDHVGGRVTSFHDFINEATVEGGGEFIGLNHPHWLHYAKIFDLPLREASDLSDLNRPIVIDGKKLTDAQAYRLFEESDALLKKLNTLAEQVDPNEPWKTPDAEKLDRISLAQWLDQQETSELTRKVARIQIGSDNGIEVEKQSLLGNLAMIKGGGLEKCWDESEWFRCENGNQLLAKELSEEIGNENILLQTPVIAIRTGKEKCEIECLNHDTLFPDEVVLTIPTSTWNRIEFHPALPRELNPQMGHAAKLLVHVNRRFWLDQKQSPEGLTNDLISQTWESTDGQESTEGYSITGFMGGAQADLSIAIDEIHRKEQHLRALNQLLPGTERHAQSARYMSWPTDPFTQGGYSFPAPGEITRIGSILHNGLHNLHFAGEHCSYGFIGYMEGALESGNRIAKKIIHRDL